MKLFRRSALLVAPLAIVLTGYFIVDTEVSPTPALAASNSVTFPPLEQLVHYTTVRRGITREHMLTNPAALAALKAGQPVPTGTHMVLVDYQSDVLTRYLVAQKIGAGADQWEYQWFCRIAPSSSTKMSPVATPATGRNSPSSSCSP